MILSFYLNRPKAALVRGKWGDEINLWLVSFAFRASWWWWVNMLYNIRYSCSRQWCNGEGRKHYFDAWGSCPYMSCRGWNVYQIIPDEEIRILLSRKIELHCVSLSASLFTCMLQDQSEHVKVESIRKLRDVLMQATPFTIIIPDAFLSFFHKCHASHDHIREWGIVLSFIFGVTTAMEILVTLACVDGFRSSDVWCPPILQLCTEIPIDNQIIIALQQRSTENVSSGAVIMWLEDEAVNEIETTPSHAPRPVEY